MDMTGLNTDLELIEVDPEIMNSTPDWIVLAHDDAGKKSLIDDIDRSDLSSEEKSVMKNSVVSLWDTYPVKSVDGGQKTIELTNQADGSNKIVTIPIGHVTRIQFDKEKINQAAQKSRNAVQAIKQQTVSPASVIALSEEENKTVKNVTDLRSKLYKKDQISQQQFRSSGKSSQNVNPVNSHMASNSFPSGLSASSSFPDVPVYYSDSGKKSELKYNGLRAWAGDPGISPHGSHVSDPENYLGHNAFVYWACVNRGFPLSSNAADAATEPDGWPQDVTESVVLPLNDEEKTLFEAVIHSWDHYYNPDWETGFAPLFTHYWASQAQGNYSSNRPSSALYLGWASHFMTDVANPEHTGFEFEQYADVALPGGYDTHSAYEGYVSTMWNQTHAGQTGANTFHQIVKNQENVNYRITNPSTATKNIAKFSHAYLPTLYYRVANQPYIDSNHRGFYDDPTVGKITENCLKIAARYTGGLVEYTMGNSINEVPIADFTGNPVFVTPGGSVQFLDKTQYSGPLTTHVDWNFGDNTPHFTADDPSPYTPENPYPHQYSTPGIYTVNLTVSNSNGATSKTMDIIVGNWPVADFMATAVVTDSEYTFHFTDLSTNSPTHWTWDFGDGNTSTEQNPSHRFAAVRQYDVTMTASNAAGPGKITKTILTLPPNPIVEFLINEGQHGPAPLVTSFKDDSVGWIDSRTWDFGDNTTSNEKDPVHVYQYPGSYVVRLTVVSNGIGSNSTTSTVVATPPLPLIANFTSTSPNGTAPLTVQFTDTSTGSPTSWNWSFGDGSYSSLQNANHTYTQYGNFDISLTVSNATSSNTTILQYFITVTPDESLKPTITSISPGMGFNSGTVSITDLTGTNFTTGSTVALVNSRLNHAGSITYGMSNVTMDIPTDVFVSGNYAYVISEEVAGLEIIDVSDPTNPIHKGSISDGSGGAHLSGLYDLHVLGNYAYLPDFYNNALEIVDVSDPANPVHKSSITNGTGGALLNRAWGVYVSGNYAYVASQWSNALEIVDISNPANPVHKGSIINGSGGARLNNPYDVYVSGNYAYVVSTGSNSLEIVNVSDPANPVHKGSIVNGAGGALLATPTDLYVSGNYAYVVSTGSNALEIVDISDPANPVHKASITNGTGGAILYAADSISVSNNNAYITSYSGSSLEVVDISDPSNPVHKVSMIDGMQGAIMRNPYGNDVSGDYVYATTLNNAGTLEILEIGTSIPATNVTVVSPTSISCKFDLSNAIVGPYDVVVTDTTGRVGSLANGFTIISDPSTPLTVSSIVPATGINTTTVSITTLSGTNFKSNATVLLTPVNSNPIHKGSITYGTGDALLEWPESVYVSGNYAYIASHDSWALEIVNISNPASPVHTSSIIAGTGGANLQCPNSVYVSGSNAYVACDCGNALEVVDISNPTSPTHKGSITDGTGGALLAGADNVYVSGNYAYITSPGDNALEIIDVSNPANPTHKGSIVDGTNGALLYQPHSVYVSGDYAYIASYGSNALEIVNISNPANPTHEGSISNGMDGALLNSPNSVYVSGDYAYIASYGSNALEIVNISNPANPTHRGSIVDGTNGALLYQPHSVYVSGDRAYVASYGSNALEIIDISNPASPAHKSSLLNGTGDAILLQPYSVFVYGDNAYVINVGRESLEIVDIGTIHATNATVVSSTQITGMFNLTNRISGPYNVVVTNTDGQTGILKNGFTVTSS